METAYKNGKYGFFHKTIINLPKVIRIQQHASIFGCMQYIFASSVLHAGLKCSSGNFIYCIEHLQLILAEFITTGHCTFSVIEVAFKGSTIVDV